MTDGRGLTHKTSQRNKLQFRIFQLFVFHVCRRQKAKLKRFGVADDQTEAVLGLPFFWPWTTPGCRPRGFVLNPRFWWLYLGPWTLAVCGRYDGAAIEPKFSCGVYVCVCLCVLAWYDKTANTRYNLQDSLARFPKVWSATAKRNNQILSRFMVATKTSSGPPQAHQSTSIDFRTLAPCVTLHDTIRGSWLRNYDSRIMMQSQISPRTRDRFQSSKLRS